MSCRDLTRQLEQIDATADEIRAHLDRLVVDIEQLAGITGGTPELDLDPIASPTQMLAELDQITDVCRQLASTVTGDTYSTVMTITARLERLADHYESEHGLHEQPQENTP